MNLTGIYRIIYPNIKEYTFYSVAHRNFSKTDHILRHKKNPNKYKKLNESPTK